MSSSKGSEADEKMSKLNEAAVNAQIFRVSRRTMADVVVDRGGNISFATGQLVRAGSCRIDGEECVGLFVAMTREELAAVRSLPMYRRVAVMEVGS